MYQYLFQKVANINHSNDCRTLSHNQLKQQLSLTITLLSSSCRIQHE